MSTRKYSLDFLKIFATVFIIFHHYQQFIGGMWNTGINFYGGKFNFGYMVELFFILSGFFMYPYIEKIFAGIPLKEFYLPRLKRLLPITALTAVAFYVLSIIYYAIFHMQEYFFADYQLWDLIYAMIGMQKGWIFGGNNGINNPVWYISVLLLCYLFFYLGISVSKRLKVSSRYFFLAMIMLGIIINTYKLNFAFLSEYTGRGYVPFFTGALLSTYLYNKRTSAKEVLCSVSIIIVWGLLFAFAPKVLQEGFPYILTFFFFPAVIVLFKSEAVEKIFNHKILAVGAEIAFNAFMWHFVVIIPMFALVSARPNMPLWCSPIGMLIYFFAVVTVAVLSYLIVQPVLNHFFKGNK